MSELLPIADTQKIARKLTVVNGEKPQPWRNTLRVRGPKRCNLTELNGQGFRLKELPDPFAGCDEATFRERTERNLRQAVSRVQQLPSELAKGSTRLARQSIAAVIPMLP